MTENLKQSLAPQTALILGPISKLECINPIYDITSVDIENTIKEALRQ